jgi:hypothetical protein
MPFILAAAERRRRARFGEHADPRVSPHRTRAMGLLESRSLKSDASVSSVAERFAGGTATTAKSGRLDAGDCSSRTAADFDTTPKRERAIWSRCDLERPGALGERLRALGRRLASGRKLQRQMRVVTKRLVLRASAATQLARNISPWPGRLIAAWTARGPFSLTLMTLTGGGTSAGPPSRRL